MKHVLATNEHFTISKNGTETNVDEVVTSLVYDVSTNNPTAGPNNDGKFTLGYILDQNNVNTLIPTSIRRGGMSIKFIQSSDNKYVQFRYMSSSTAAADFTNVANWQGVDDVPTAGSDNLVKSGGVYAEVEKKANTDGYYETMGVGTADNLTGQTERSDAAMYRKTGGSEEVASGTATISNIKGQTVAWNQLVKNGNFDGSTEWAGLNATFTVSNNIATIIPVTANGGINNYTKFTKSHTYYLSFDSWTENKGSIFIYYGQFPTGIRFSLSKDRVKKSSIFTATMNNAPYVWFRFGNPSRIYYLSNVNIIDLTLIYGEGNEPSTAEEFETDYQRWFGKPLDYEPYDNGSLRSVQLDSLKTTGFNQYNNGQARVIGGLQYQITGTYTKLYPTVTLIDYTYGNTVAAGTYYTNDDNHFVGAKTVSTYDNTKTYALGSYCAYDGAIYKSNVAIETAEEFDATHWDIIDNVAAMVTEGILTLWDITPDASGLFTPSTTGTLTITGGGNDTCVHISGDRNGEYEPYEEHSVSLSVTTITGKLNGEGESVVVFPDGMNKFDNIYTIEDKTFAVVGGQIRTYQDGDATSDTMVTDGVNNTYVALETPQVYELDTFDLSVRYQVDANGTEEQIQKSGVQGLAAILTCIYGVDAVKILDKLPQNYISEKSMDNFLAQLNTVTGGTWTKTWNDSTGEWDFSFTPNAQTNDTNIEETI